MVRKFFSAVVSLSLFQACSSDLALVRSLEVVETEPKELQLRFYPPDQQEIEINPPGFTWPREKEAESYKLMVVDEGGSVVFEAGDLSSSVAPPMRELKAGKYRWMVVYLNGEGVPLGRSEERAFTIKKGASILLKPDNRELRTRLQGIRPRLFLTPQRLRSIREAIDEESIFLLSDFRELLEAGMKEPLYPEPEGYDPDKQWVSEWRRIYTPAKVGSAHMVRSALAYQLTGESRYLERARDWLLHFADWDPRGIASHDVSQPDGTVGNDEASMPILERSAIVYDWIGESLDEEEKERLFTSIEERGNQVLALLEEQDFLSNPFSNHEGRVLAFLGLAGLSFLGEIPDADRWLDYVLSCYLTSYPVWGGDDGGWAQGINYWSAYLLWLTEFSEALRAATEVNLYKRPFFKNTGKFALYFHPPYSDRGAFGDGAESPPSLAEKLLLLKLATAMNDSSALWHSRAIDPITDFPEERRWFEWFMEDIHSILHVPPDDLEAEPPKDLPPTKWLRNEGWVASHLDLADEERNVWLLFKSSRFGSFSHSHADQNSFQLSAYGEPLLIDSGYYPSYGSPHHNLWTRQTRAHNAVLINGRGQSVGSMEAAGEILYVKDQDGVTVMSGDASKAYNVPASDSIKRQWKEHVGPFPAETPEALAVRRTIAFIRSRELPWLAVHDFVRTSEPTAFQYLLHTVNPMKVDVEGNTVEVEKGDARLLVRLIATEDLSMTQSDVFTVPPEERRAGAPPQFHLEVESDSAAREIKFLALLLPFRKGETRPEIEVIEQGELRGFQVGEERVLAWWGEGEVGELPESGSAEGRMLVETIQKNEKRLVLCE